MSHVSIIGTGNMGQAIAGGRRPWRAHRGAPRPDDAATAPRRAGRRPRGALPRRRGRPRGARRRTSPGKVVVDITNPLDFAETFDSLTVAADGSAAAEIAAALPDSRVLKAFNTTFAGTLAAGTVGSLTTTVLIAGDDADAKALLAGIVTSGGLEAVDAGSLARARELEALGFLQITLAANEKVSWTGGFGMVA